MAFLDENGVLYFWGKVKAHVSSAIGALSIPNNTNQLINGAGFQTASDVQTAINSAVAGMYKYKGSVATAANLPASGNTNGDVWNVEQTGMNYAWNGSAWDSLGEAFDVQSITNAEIDAICT